MLNTSHAVRIITEGKSARVVRVFSLVVPFVLSALFLLRFSPQVSFSGFQLPFVFTSSLLNLVLVGTYFYSYKAFDDHFYFFIASFWLSIAIYAILDYGSPAPHSSEWLQYKSVTNLLYVSSSAFLMIAILLIDRRTIFFRLKKTIIVVLSVGLGYLALVYFLASRFEATEQSPT